MKSKNSGHIEVYFGKQQDVDIFLFFETMNLDAATQQHQRCTKEKKQLWRSGTERQRRHTPARGHGVAIHIVTMHDPLNETHTGSKMLRRFQTKFTNKWAQCLGDTLSSQFGSVSAILIVTSHWNYDAHSRAAWHHNFPRRHTPQFGSRMGWPMLCVVAHTHHVMIAKDWDIWTEASRRFWKQNTFNA